MRTSLDRQAPVWARVAIGALAAAIAVYGGLAIVSRHHIGRTRHGGIVESTGAVAVGMGLFYLGGALVMASIALPRRLRMPALIVGAIFMVAGIIGALYLRPSSIT